MTLETRILVAQALPPIRLPAVSPNRFGHDQALLRLRLRRIAYVAAALALPVLGIASADAVHRASDTRTSQTTAPVATPDGGAVPSGTVTPSRAPRAARTAAVPQVRT